MKKQAGLIFIAVILFISSTFSIFANEELSLKEEEKVAPETVASEVITEDITDEDVTEEQTKEETDEANVSDKKISEKAVAAVKQIKGTPRAITQSGTIGTVDWSLDDAGVLTFGGGTFPDNYDWYNYNRSTLGQTLRSETKIINFTAPIAGGNKLDYMFSEYSILTTINGLNNLDTSRATTLFAMFNMCTNLTNLDLSGFDTSNVTTMEFMFYGCGKLIKLDISGFNTVKLTRMGYMFYAAIIKEMVLGPDFRFKFTNHDLWIAAYGEYTGNWKYVPTGELFTNQEFVTYDGTKPGTYIWEIRKFNVNYNSNGGSLVASEAVEYNEKATQPANPTKAGYTFGGWFKEATFTNQWDFATDVVPMNDMTLYAKWNANPYNLNYNSNGGSAVASEIVGYNEKATKPTNPTRVGYTFAGWYKEAGLVNEWNFITDVMPMNDITLYAKWNINSYNITYTSNGGSAVAGQTADYNTALTKPTNPTKTGYTFDGWYKEAGLVNEWNFATDLMPANNITLYAKWNINTYDITYDSNGGSAVAGQRADYNTALTRPTNPTKTGYTFAGWYKEATFTNQWNFATDLMPANNITLYAKWNINSYNITYTSNGGSAVSVQTADYNTVLTKPTNPTKTGYTFEGWYKEAGLVNQWDFATDLMPANNITLYAKWSINTYDVTYNTNGGSLIGGETVEYNSAVTEPANPIKVGYTFEGWYKEVGLTNQWNFVADLMPANDVILYAKWKALEYQITYDLDGGTNSSNNPSTYEFATGVTSFEAPTKDGYKFLGWFESATSNIEITNIGTTEMGDKTLYARWEKIETAVNPDNNGKTGTTAKTETTESRKGTKTGDEANLLGVLVILIASAGYLVTRKRRQNNG